jgi:P4 family phage/plasmid primase-like protien
MNAMLTSAPQYNDFNDFLTRHNLKNLEDKQVKVTHTRIGNPDYNVYGGSWHIQKEELEVFHNMYYENVFVKNRKEYLTEAQLENCGPILVDFDFRYDYAVTERIHTSAHIQDMIELYLDELKELLVFEEKKAFPIFIMEKPNVNRVADKKITKDGIHMIIGIQMDHTLQMMLREKIVEKLGERWELPLINSWNDVLDEGISKGKTNWQMYGSQKPGNEAYSLTHYIIAEIDKTDNEFMTKAQNVRKFDLSKNFSLLSAQYDKHPKFDINPKIKDEYEKRCEKGITTKKHSTPKCKVNLLVEEEDDDNYISIEDIQDAETLKRAVDAIMSSLKTKELYIEEIHRYTQILPEKYYKPGSHLLNRQVAFALKHTDKRLFLSWVMLRSKAADFDYNTIPSLYNEWNKFRNKTDGVTKRSIMYWAKQDAFEDYERVKKQTIDHYIEETITDAGDWDYAMVLYHMYKDKYLCSDLHSPKSWYVFEQNRWMQDKGDTLRMAISKDLFQLYSDKQGQYMAELQQYDTNDKHHENIQRNIKKIAEICIRFKKTNDKNNIMREAKEIFFDKDFIKQMDSNKYLMCFTNGVVDFKNKIFRQGYPQDYITKTTGIPYYPYDPLRDKSMVDDIIDFMKKLFPQPDLCRYMWDHLAASLIGVKKEHAFNIYRGSGSNGKSILTDLMTKALGEYKGVVPITLVTEKRGLIGGTSSEIISLKGIRYAVMQEPSKELSLNEGVMKELTGGDAIQGRALYSDSEIFELQCSLVVCTNSLFEIKSNDDGTWRRMKLVDFVSKFVSEGEIHSDDTPYVFPKDKGLKEKLEIWAPVFVSMLVKRAFETEGEVIDCPEVISASNKYRQNQDCLSGFITDKIIKTSDPNIGIGKKILNDIFKEWFQMNFGNRKMPKLSELEEVMIKRFGNRNNKTNKWHGIQFKVDEENGNDIDNLM